MIPEKRKERRRSNRVNISVSALTNKKLKQLATACNKKPATLAQLLIDYCLDNSKIVDEFQTKYNTDPAYLVKSMSGLTAYEEIMYLVGVGKN